MSDDDRRILAAIHDDLTALTSAGDGVVHLGTLFDGIFAIREQIREHLKVAGRDDA